ncbi:transcription elongation factor SPT6-like [Tropilaelaps mercedesae]|uniref:Transcription elongation factor SPT6-like n=1 Tax=Tropilaelaps mercedesae TaxID=418985 RepID=A0A1V9X3A7_9ACAR|nr:transcription elongation factor SPT6-like [Tropilaelaps mercedesae]
MDSELTTAAEASTSSGSRAAAENKKCEDDKNELTGHEAAGPSELNKQANHAKLPDQGQPSSKQMAESDQPKQAGIHGANQQANAEAASDGSDDNLQRQEESESSWDDTLSDNETESDDGLEHLSMTEAISPNTKPFPNCRRRKVFLKYCWSPFDADSIEPYSVVEVQCFNEVSDLHPLGNITRVVPFPELDFNSEDSARRSGDFKKFRLEDFSQTDRGVALKDEPERYQLRSVPVLPADDEELKAEAEWIFWHCFDMPTISLQRLMHASVPQFILKDLLPSKDQRYPDHQPPGGRRNPSCVLQIFQALKCIRQQQLDIPFINEYRKELIAGLCTYDLWLIYKWDERWCRLNHGKRSMEGVLREAQKHLSALIKFNCCDRLRDIQEADFQHLHEVQTPEELRDIYQHFVLYYGHKMPGLALAFQRLMMNAEYLLRNYGQERVLGLLPSLAIGDPEGAPKSSHASCSYDTDTNARRFESKGSFASLMNTRLYGLAQLFGLTPERFAENLSKGYQRHKVVRCLKIPLKAAAMFVNDSFKTPEEALKAARYIVAREIAHDPNVRRVVRKAFFEQAKLNVKPLDGKKKKILKTDPVYPILYLRDRPVRTLEADEYIRLQVKESEEEADVSLLMDNRGVTGSHEAAYIRMAYAAYHCHEESPVDVLWNSQREAALRCAFYGILYPMLEEELKCRLMREASDHVLLACANQLNEWLDVAPYMPDLAVRTAEGFDVSDGTRILGLATGGDDDPQMYGVVINGHGRVVEVAHLYYFVLKNSDTCIDDEVLAESEPTRLKEVLCQERPHCVVIGVSDHMAPVLKVSIEEVIRQLGRERNFPPIEVFLLNDNVASAYSLLPLSEMEFLRSEHEVKRAVSLARRMQNPLCEFVQLCDNETTITTLAYHALQSDVPLEELSWMIEAEFVNCVNQAGYACSVCWSTQATNKIFLAGVDLNRCCSDFRALNLLQFVSGFGRFKARHLIQLYSENSEPVIRRVDLRTQLQLGANVYLNSAAFFRIVPESLPVELRKRVSLIDNSRIHPEMYWCVIKLARRILNDEMRDPNEAVKEMAEKHSCKLNMKPLAAALERNGFGRKLATLLDIQTELKENFSDRRRTYVEPDKKKLFYEMIRETPQTFYEGKKVKFEILHKRMGPKRNLTEYDLPYLHPTLSSTSQLYICPQCLQESFEDESSVEDHLLDECPGECLGIEIRLDNRARGFLRTRHFDDDDAYDPQDALAPGTQKTGRIMRINFDKLNVEVTCRKVDDADETRTFKLRKSQYFDYVQKGVRYPLEEEIYGDDFLRTYADFLLMHPSCWIFRHDEISDLLRSREQGFVVCWPSPKDMPFVNLTWKVHRDIYQTLEVQRTTEKSGVIMCEVDGEEFRGIGDLIARHIYPMAAYARQILEHRYFNEFDGGVKHLADQWLSVPERRSMAARGNRSRAFCFSAFKHYPGRFLFAFSGGDVIVHDVIQVTPGGFFYQNRIFESLDSLVRWNIDNV